MRIKSREYAKVLVELILQGKVKEKVIIEGFLRLLKKNGDFKKAKEIIQLAEIELIKKTGNKKVILETARKNEIKDSFKHFIEKGDIVSEKINADLIAGIKIIVNDERQLDFSLKSKLDKIFEYVK